MLPAWRGGADTKECDMRTRSRGPWAGFGWLKRGIGASFRHPKPLWGGAALLLLLCLLPSMLALPFQLHALGPGARPDPVLFAGLMAGSALLGLLLIPLYAGFLQVVDAAERGLPARARDIFMPYRAGEALPLIGYGLALIAIYVIAFGTVVVATGGGIARWYLQMLSAQAHHQPPPMALPQGFGVALTLLVLLGLFMTGFYAISLGQVALRRRSVFGAIGDGLVGALKNALPLTVFAVSLVVAWVGLMLGLLLVVGVLALLGKLVGVWLVLVLVIPLYVVLLLGILTAGFGVGYHLWRDVCGDDPAMPAAVTA